MGILGNYFDKKHIKVMQDVMAREDKMIKMLGRIVDEIQDLRKRINFLEIESSVREEKK